MRGPLGRYIYVAAYLNFSYCTEPFLYIVNGLNLALDLMFAMIPVDWLDVFNFVSTGEVSNEHVLLSAGNAKLEMCVMAHDLRAGRHRLLTTT